MVQSVCRHGLEKGVVLRHWRQQSCRSVFGEKRGKMSEKKKREKPEEKPKCVGIVPDVWLGLSWEGLLGQVNYTCVTVLKMMRCS